jgi:hypothetical protein
MEPVLHHTTADWRRSFPLACIAGFDVLIDMLGGPSESIGELFTILRVSKVTIMFISCVSSMSLLS